MLYRASVAEAGDVERVVKAPQHPYTQLLIGSIPQVSTQRSWLDEQPAGTARAVRPAAAGSSTRCPVAMPICQTTVPPPRQTEPDRVVACHRA